jgi:hypothetical protein
MTARGRALASALPALSLALLLAACAPQGARPAGQGPGVPVATPVASLTPSLATTVAELRAAVAGTGYRLDVPLAPYRPSEPAALVDAPRTVLRASTADTRQGFLVVYELEDEVAAAARAQDLAAHVGSGFGQTNFPGGAQFHVAHQRDTVIFTWWARLGGADEAAERVFDAVRVVGTAVPVLR